MPSWPLARGDSGAGCLDLDGEMLLKLLLGCRGLGASRAAMSFVTPHINVWSLPQDIRPTLNQAWLLLQIVAQQHQATSSYRAWIGRETTDCQVAPPASVAAWIDEKTADS